MTHHDEFKAAMGRFATGVTVATTVVDGIDHAMTANSLVSVSLDPVLVSISVQRPSRFHDAVIKAGFWGVSILAREQEAASRWFATPGRPVADQMHDFPFTRGETGTALLENSLVTLECRTRQVIPAGDHDILLADVLTVSHRDADPLLYFRKGYHGLD